MLVSLTKACVLVEVFRCQITSIIVGLRPHQTTTGHFYHAHLIWELSWSNACIGYKWPHFLKRSLHQWADYSRWNSLIDVTWRTVNKEQIYQRAHWSLNTVSGIFVVNHYRHLRVIYLVDLPAINGNSLMAVDCIYLHRSDCMTCYLNLFYFSVVLHCSHVIGHGISSVVRFVMANFCG